MCIKISYIPNKEWLLIWDEIKYAKILSYNRNTKKFDVEKEYFVNDNFGHIYGEPLDGIQYSNGMLYSNSNTYLLQERGTEKNTIIVSVSEKYSLIDNIFNSSIILNS